MDRYTYLALKRLNIDVMLWINDKDILHYGVRLRPWKQEGRYPVMILSQGITLDDAMKNAAIAHYKEEWEKLDWSIRPWTNRAADFLTEEGNKVVLDFLNDDKTVTEATERREDGLRIIPPANPSRKTNRDTLGQP